MTETILLILLAAGILTMLAPEAEDIYRLVRRRLSGWWKSFHSEEDWLKQQKERYEEQLKEHLRLLLQMTLSMGTKKSVRGFLLVSGCFGGLVLLVTAGRIGSLLAAAASVSAALHPYLLLCCMLQGKRVASSQEGEILVTELLNHYKIHYCNMQHAVETAAMQMEDAPHCRQLLLNLSRGLQKASTAAEVKGLLEEFRFSIGTAWADILATNIYLACSSGLRVTESLSDLALTMRQARQLEEFSRREQNEARLMLKYLIPLGSLLMAGAGIHFFGLSLEEYLHYQFRTGTGITWFCLWLVSYLLAGAVYLLLSKRKFDF